eukprot:8907366-Heterocapsa_arctica.AAC.1
MNILSWLIDKREKNCSAAQLRKRKGKTIREAGLLPHACGRCPGRGEENTVNVSCLKCKVKAANRRGEGVMQGHAL